MLDHLIYTPYYEVGVEVGMGVARRNHMLFAPQLRAKSVQLLARAAFHSFLAAIRGINVGRLWLPRPNAACARRTHPGPGVGVHHRRVGGRVRVGGRSGLVAAAAARTRVKFVIVSYATTGIRPNRARGFFAARLRRGIIDVACGVGPELS